MVLFDYDCKDVVGAKLAQLVAMVHNNLHLATRVAEAVCKR